MCPLVTWVQWMILRLFVRKWCVACEKLGMLVMNLQIHLLCLFDPPKAPSAQASTNSVFRILNSEPSQNAMWYFSLMQWMEAFPWCIALLHICFEVQSIFKAFCDTICNWSSWKWVTHVAAITLAMMRYSDECERICDHYYHVFLSILPSKVAKVTGREEILDQETERKKSEIKCILSY